MVYYVPVYHSAIWDQAHAWSVSSEVGALAALGFRVRFTAPGQLIGLRYLRQPADDGAHIGLVCPNDGERPIVATLQKPPFDADVPVTAEWHAIYIRPRVRITVGVTYEVGVWYERLIYGYEPFGTAADIVQGPITIPADEGSGGRRNGIYSYGGPTLGFNAGFSHLYAVDVIFLPD